MSATESQYGERFFELDRAISKQMDKDNAQRQYNKLVAQGEDTYFLGDVEQKFENFDAWFKSGNYDPRDWE